MNLVLSMLNRTYQVLSVEFGVDLDHLVIVQTFVQCLWVKLGHLLVHTLIFFVLITLIALFELMLEFSSYACGGISYIWNDVVHIEVERHLTLMFIYTPTSSLRQNWWDLDLVLAWWDLPYLKSNILDGMMKTRHTSHSDLPYLLSWSWVDLVLPFVCQWGLPYLH